MRKPTTAQKTAWLTATIPLSPVVGQRIMLDENGYVMIWTGATWEHDKTYYDQIDVSRIGDSMSIPLAGKTFVLEDADLERVEEYVVIVTPHNLLLSKITKNPSGFKIELFQPDGTPSAGVADVAMLGY